MDLVAQSVQTAFESSLQAAVEKVAVNEQLRTVIQYSLFPAGKRIRPLIALAICRALGGLEQKAIDVVCALEFVHASSLIHDDLPALDDDDFRRGRPSSHKKFNEASAILAGDLLIAESFNLIARSNFDATVRILLTEELSSSFVQLCYGQFLDLQHGEDRAPLQNIHMLKTGALFGAACAFGAICAEASHRDRIISRQLGCSIGILFQIVDDLIDQSGTTEKGRPASSDQKNSKETFLNHPADHSTQQLLSGINNDITQILQELETDQKRKENFAPIRQLIQNLFSRVS